MAASMLGVPFDSVTLRTGDTDFVVKGSGSHSARSMRVGGHLFTQTAQQVIDKGRQVAARLFECAVDDVNFEHANESDDDGVSHYRVAGTDRTCTLFDVAVHACSAQSALPEDLSGPLFGLAEIEVPMPAYPNGTHVAEVEVDAQTGGRVGPMFESYQVTRIRAESEFEQGSGNEHEVHSDLKPRIVREITGSGTNHDH